jgi:hypothetical protein
MSVKKFCLSILAILALVLPVSLVSVATAPTASASTNLTETFNCNMSGFNGVYSGYCKGSWFAGTPGTRSAYLNLDNVTYEDTNYRSQRVYSVASNDGRKKVFEWRCAYDGGTTSSLLATTTVGGGLANSFVWPSGYSPCNGNQGIEVNIKATYGNYTYLTQVWIQAPASSGGGGLAKKWKGVQQTA